MRHRPRKLSRNVLCRSFVGIDSHRVAYATCLVSPRAFGVVLRSSTCEYPRYRDERGDKQLVPAISAERDRHRRRGSCQGYGAPRYARVTRNRSRRWRCSP
ncbi:hypothetical protein PUN28_019359 [Cardiocondyla obscurior]|uniref:Uncharacterized protein n=1 Tax=Cardiocondyla obscurior TaxID=286306 RepID=A0AAW2EFG5_9HYME